MPTYQYECESCAYVFDHLQSMTDKKLKKCPKCSKLSLVRHIGSGSGVIFKGSGFYETDYKNKPASPAGGPVPSGGHCHSGACGCASTPVSPKPGPKA